MSSWVLLGLSLKVFNGFKFFNSLKVINNLKVFNGPKVFNGFKVLRSSNTNTNTEEDFFKICMKIDRAVRERMSAQTSIYKQ